MDIVDSGILQDLLKSPQPMISSAAASAVAKLSIRAKVTRFYRYECSVAYSLSPLFVGSLSSYIYIQALSDDSSEMTQLLNHSVQTIRNINTLQGYSE